MRPFRIFLTLAFTLLPISAIADEITVRAGRTSGLYDFAVWDADTCSHLGKIQFRLVRPPKHGTVTTLWTTSSVSAIPARCKGKIKGLQVFYTPDKGYRGPDDFRMSLLAPRFQNDNAPTAQTVSPKLMVK